MLAMNAIAINQYVTSSITGQRGIVRGIWTNFANQTVVNVKADGISQSWNVADVAEPAEILDGEYDRWLDFLAANSPLEEDPLYFNGYVQDVEDSEDAYHFYRALGNLQVAIADWQDGAR